MNIVITMPIKIMNIVIIMPNKYVMYVVEKVYNNILDYVILFTASLVQFNLQYTGSMLIV